jgi:hypothetical protein
MEYGGSQATSHPASWTWELRQAPFRPGLACAYRFDAAQAGEGAALLGLRVDAQGGADPGGAQLQLWEAGQWRTLASCDGGCPAASPAPLSYETTDPTQINLLLSDRDLLGAGVVSASPNGSGAAQLQAGPVQVTVRYRLP